MTASRSKDKAAMARVVLRGSLLHGVAFGSGWQRKACILASVLGGGRWCCEGTEEEESRPMVSSFLALSFWVALSLTFGGDHWRRSRKDGLLERVVVVGVVVSFASACACLDCRCRLLVLLV